MHDSPPVTVNYRGKLLQLVAMPVKAPDLIGWACMGSFIGDDFVQRVKDATGSEISLLARSADEAPICVAALEPEMHDSRDERQREDARQPNCGHPAESLP